MTLHQLFDLSSMEHRNLLAAYAAVFLLQGSYFVWILLSSLRLRRK